MTSVWQPVDIKHLDEQKIEWEKLLYFYDPTELVPNVHIMTSILSVENALGFRSQSKKIVFPMATYVFT